MQGSTVRLSERCKLVTGLSNTVPSSTTPDYVSLKTANRMTIVILGKNGVTVTGSAITLLQATSVAGTSEKALAFSTMRANTDTGASDTLVDTTVTSNTFTTTNTNSKEYIYEIDIDPASLDVNNGFDCVRVGTGNAVNATITALYILDAKYRKATPPAAITD